MKEFGNKHIYLLSDLGPRLSDFSMQDKEIHTTSEPTQVEFCRTQS